MGGKHLWARFRRPKLFELLHAVTRSPMANTWPGNVMAIVIIRLKNIEKMPGTRTTDEPLGVVGANIVLPLTGKYSLLLQIRENFNTMGVSSQPFSVSLKRICNAS